MNDVLLVGILYIRRGWPPSGCGWKSGCPCSASDQVARLWG